MKILFALLVLIFISCNPKKINYELKTDISKKIEVLQVNPERFIKKLPKQLAENSGIIYYNNLLWTFNDSGGENKIYGFNFEGEIKKEIEINAAKNIDWEDIAQDKKHIYIGDFGNNNGQRKNQKIYKIKKKDIGKKEKQKVNAKEIKFEFQNQESFNFQPKYTPFDCEAFVEFDNNLYVFTKDWTDRTTTVYQIPKEKGDYSIVPSEKFDVGGLITGADISADKTKLVLVGYKNYKPILWLFNIVPGKFFGGEKIYIELDNIFDAQTEGVCFLGNDSLLISCEQSSTFIQQIFLVNLKTLQ